MTPIVVVMMMVEMIMVTMKMNVAVMMTVKAEGQGWKVKVRGEGDDQHVHTHDPRLSFRAHLSQNDRRNWGSPESRLPAVWLFRLQIQGFLGFRVLGF